MNKESRVVCQGTVGQRCCCTGESIFWLLLQLVSPKVWMTRLDGESDRKRTPNFDSGRGCKAVGLA